MESPIILTADSKEALNQQIDVKLKEGYLLKNGMQTNDDGLISQTMVLPSNIDSEFTLSAAIKIAIFLPLYLLLLYFIL